MIAAGLLFGIPMMIISVTIHGMLMKKVSGMQKQMKTVTD